MQIFTLSTFVVAPILCPTLIWFQSPQRWKKKRVKQERMGGEDEVASKMGKDEEWERSRGVNNGVKSGVKSLRIGFFSEGDEIQYAQVIFNKYHMRYLLKDDFISSVLSDPVALMTSFKYTHYLVYACLIIDSFSKAHCSFWSLDALTLRP